MATVSRKNGVIVSSDALDGWFNLSAEIALNEMFGYSTELRSQTQGKGEFTMEYSRCVTIGNHIVKAIRARTKVVA